RRRSRSPDPGCRHRCAAPAAIPRSRDPPAAQPASLSRCSGAHCATAVPCPLPTRAATSVPAGPGLADIIETAHPVAPAQEPVLRKRRQQWLLSLTAAARGRRRLAAVCTVAAGWLLLPQAWALAVLLQGVLVDADPPLRWSGWFALL